MNELMSKFVHDATGRKCPDCSSKNIQFQEVEAIRYGRYDRDYECQNCGAEWLMLGPEETQP